MNLLDKDFKSTILIIVVTKEKHGQRTKENIENNVSPKKISMKRQKLQKATKQKFWNWRIYINSLGRLRSRLEKT